MNLARWYPVSGQRPHGRAHRGRDRSGSAIAGVADQLTKHLRKGPLTCGVRSFFTGIEYQQALFERKPHLAVYRRRLLLVALCQGGALHYVDCHKGLKRKNAVNYLDRPYGKAGLGFVDAYPHPARFIRQAD